VGPLFSSRTVRGAVTGGGKRGLIRPLRGLPSGLPSALRLPSGLSLRVEDRLEESLRPTGDYDALLRQVLDGQDKELLRYFILTVGVVSNHGNWFTAEDHNKELKVLAHSYDWLLFLTDAVCFLYDTRLRFLVEGRDEGKGAPMSCAMVYWGAHFSRFEAVFLSHGAVVSLHNLKGKTAGEPRNGQRRLFATNGAVKQ